MAKDNHDISVQFRVMPRTNSLHTYTHTHTRPPTHVRARTHMHIHTHRHFLKKRIFQLRKHRNIENYGNYLDHIDLSLDPVYFAYTIFNSIL